MAAVSKTVEQQCLEGSTPSPSAREMSCSRTGLLARPGRPSKAVLLPRALGRSAKAPVFQTGQAGSIPAGHFGARHTLCAGAPHTECAVYLRSLTMRRNQLAR